MGNYCSMMCDKRWEMLSAINIMESMESKVYTCVSEPCNSSCVGSPSYKVLFLFIDRSLSVIRSMETWIELVRKGRKFCTVGQSSNVYRSELMV